MGDFKKFEDLFFIPIRPLNSVDDPNELAKGEAGFHYPSRTWVLRDPNTGEFVRPNKFDGALSIISERIDENNRLFSHGVGQILFYNKLTDIKTDLDKTTVQFSDLLTHMANKSVYVEEYTGGSADYANLAPSIKSGSKGHLKISKINGTIFATFTDDSGAEYRRIVSATDAGTWSESGTSADIKRLAFGGVVGYAAEPTTEAASRGTLEMSIGSNNSYPAPMPLTTKSIPLTYTTKDSYTPGGMMSFATQGAVDYPNYLKGISTMGEPDWVVTGADKVDCPDSDKVLFKATANTVVFKALVNNKAIAASVDSHTNIFYDLNVFVDRAGSQITEVKAYSGANKAFTHNMVREFDTLFMKTDYPLKFDSPTKLFDHFRFRGGKARGSQTMVGSDKVLLVLEVKFNTIVDKKNPFIAFDIKRPMYVSYDRSADIPTTDWEFSNTYMPAEGFGLKYLNYTLTGRRLDNPDKWLDVPLSPANLPTPGTATSLLADAVWTGGSKNTLVNTVYSNNGIRLEAPGRAVVYYHEKGIQKKATKGYKDSLNLFVPNSSWFLVMVEKTVPTSIVTSTFGGDNNAATAKPRVIRHGSNPPANEEYIESKLFHKQGIGTWGGHNFKGHNPTSPTFSENDINLHGWQTVKLNGADLTLHNGSGFQYVETPVIPDTMVERVGFISRKVANVAAGTPYSFWARWGYVSIAFPTGTFATLEEARELISDFEVSYRKPHRLDQFSVKAIEINNVIPADATFIPGHNAIKFTSIVVPGSEGAKQSDVYNKLMDISLAMTDLSNIVNKGDSSSSGITGAVNVGPTGKRTIVVPNFPHQPGRDILILYENDKPLIEGLDFVSRKLPDGKIELTRTQGNWTPNATIRVISLKSLITEQDSAKMVPMIFKSQYSVTAAARNTIPIAIDVYNPESTGETLMVTENNYVIYRGLNFDVKHGTIQRENGTNYVGWYIELKDYQAQKGYEYNFNLIKAVASNDVKDVTSIAALEGRISILEQGGLGGSQGTLGPGRSSIDISQLENDIEAIRQKIQEVEGRIQAQSNTATPSVDLNPLTQEINTLKQKIQALETNASSSGSGGGGSDGIEIFELDIDESLLLNAWYERRYSAQSNPKANRTFNTYWTKVLDLKQEPFRTYFLNKDIIHVEYAGLAFREEAGPGTTHTMSGTDLAASDLTNISAVYEHNQGFIVFISSYNFAGFYFSPRIRLWVANKRKAINRYQVTDRVKPLLDSKISVTYNWK